jgi:hypothetical protein
MPVHAGTQPARTHRLPSVVQPNHQSEKLWPAEDVVHQSRQQREHRGSTRLLDGPATPPASFEAVERGDAAMLQASRAGWTELSKKMPISMALDRTNRHSCNGEHGADAALKAKRAGRRDDFNTPIRVGR